MLRKGSEAIGARDPSTILFLSNMIDTHTWRYMINVKLLILSHTEKYIQRTEASATSTRQVSVALYLFAAEFLVQREEHPCVSCEIFFKTLDVYSMFARPK